MYIYVNVYITYVCMYVYMYVYIHIIHANTHTHTQTHTHTRTHTCIHWSRWGNADSFETLNIIFGWLITFTCLEVPRNTLGTH